MFFSGIPAQRLINQQIASTVFTKPQELVSWMGAVQAQDFAMAKWALGLRLPGSTDAMIEQAMNEGSIIRTHVLRPTWHFVAPADLRWMLALTAPRVKAISAYYYRKSGLDNAVFKRSNQVLTKALQGEKQLTRTALKAALEKAKIETDHITLTYLLMHAELDAVICSGPRQGKQFTYALLEERVPPARKLTHDEALAALTERYFRSRGPATLQDFAWWSGLTLKDARAGASTLPSQFVQETINGKAYIYAPSKLTLKDGQQATFLLPDYDEYGISYKDRSAIFTGEHAPEKRGGNLLFNHMIIIDGMIAGTWKRTVKKEEVSAEALPFTSLGKAKQQAVKDAVERYHLFANNSGQKEKTTKKRKLTT